MPSKSIRTAEAKKKTRLYLMMGIATLLIVIITIITAGKQLTLRCDRLASGEADCRVQQSILGVIPLNSKVIAGAQAVSMGQECKDVVCKYRLEIYATQGLVPMVEKYSSNYDQLQKIKNQVNEFFKDKTRSFVELTEETNPVLMAGVAAVAVIIWAYLFYLWRQE